MTQFYIISCLFLTVQKETILQSTDLQSVLSEIPYEAILSLFLSI